MAIGRLPAPEIGALRCILCSIVDRSGAFFVVSSFYFLLSVAGITADVQVNSPDHNVPDQDDTTTENEPSLAVAGSLVVVGYNSTKPVNNQFRVSQYAFSTNGGATFTDGGAVPASGNGSLGGDPALAFSPDGTTLYYASIGKDGGNASRIFVNPSTSLSPVTFGVPVAISGRTSGAAQDKELIAVDTTQSSFRGRVYVAWSEFVSGSPPDGASQILFAASSSTSPLDFSAIPQVLSTVTAVNHGAMPAVAPNGDVYVVWGVFTPAVPPGTPAPAAPQTIQIVRSTDGGASFQNPDPADTNPSKTIASVTSTVGRMCDKVGTPPKCPDGLNIRTRGFPYIAIDQTPPGSPTRGNIYVVFQATPPAPASARSQIFFTRSTDGGKTWDTSRSISNGPAVTLNGDPTQRDNWMPSIAVSPVTGHIRVIFYSRREDPQNIDIRVYDAGSTDGGLTWFNQPRSTTAFRPSTGYDTLLKLGGERGRAHMGDYISVVAAGSNFYAVWTDARNKCTPPSGAPKPCSSPGRGDQDVFFSTDTDPVGADLAITPWGSVTGQGPAWQSPDIFVVDNGNNVVNAKQGIINGLRARIRNLGNAAANGATVRFTYAPYSIGLTAAGFKEIAAPTVNFATAGDGSGNDLIVVPAQWDLTNPSEDNGGIWPMPISSFEHFCVRVAAELSADINQSNNAAQTNFVDVTEDCCRRFRFLIGNPFERDIRTRFVIGPLPRGYSVKLEAGSKNRNTLSLRPKEIRVATAQFVRPAGVEKERRTSDVVASISMRVDNQLISGFSVLLAKANAPAQPAPPPQPPRRTPRSR
jgi:WD40-like Beta Propeller Repeat